MVIAIKSQATPEKHVPAVVKSNELTVIAKVIKGDTFMVMADSSKELEDEFANLYYTGTSSGDAALALEPPFNPKILRGLVKKNNILSQCVQAMEVNIDGTGHEFVKAHPEVEIDSKELQTAKEFFEEPYPGKNWISMRRSLRVDLESMGYGYFEALRTLSGDLAGLRPLEATTIRMVRLGEAKKITSAIQRGGVEVEFTSWERPRRFIQLLNGVTKQYYKEFGNKLKLHRKTGAWIDEKETIKPEDLATELLVFGLDKDNTGPYWVPRWINQLPSVLGSRKAEEHNLEFFDSGGMPPAIIFIQGGQMVGEAANNLRTYLSGQNRKKGRAVVVELVSNAGTLDSSGSVTARVERFGGDKNDAMYSAYDKAAEDHVRVGFRLPPLFLGRSADYSYATASISYQIAEAQVFQPERAEFDEQINKSVIRELGLKTLKFKSKPITLKSVTEAMKGLELLDGKVGAGEWVQEMNSLIGANLSHVEPPPPPEPEPPKPAANANALVDPLTNIPYDKPTSPEVAARIEADKERRRNEAAQKVQAVGMKGEGANKNKGVPKAPTKKSTLELLHLVRKYTQINGIVDTGWVAKSDQEHFSIPDEVEALSPDERKIFQQMLTEYQRVSVDGS